MRRLGSGSDLGLRNFDFSNDRRGAAAMGQFLLEAGPALKRLLKTSITARVGHARSGRRCLRRRRQPSPIAPISDNLQISSTPMSMATGTLQAATATAFADGVSFSSRGAMSMPPSHARSAKPPEQAAQFCDTTEGAASVRLLVSGQQRLPALGRPMGHRRDHSPGQRRRHGGRWASDGNIRTRW